MANTGSSAWTNYDTQRQIVFSTDLPLTEPIPGGVNRQATSAQSGVTADEVRLLESAL